MQLHQPPPQCLVSPTPLRRLAVLPAVIPAARDLQYPACLLHSGSLAAHRLDAAVLLLYGFDRMPTDFFKTSMTSSFSFSCLRRARFSASNSRMRRCSRFRRLAWPSGSRTPLASCAACRYRFPVPWPHLRAGCPLLCHQPHRPGFECLIIPWRPCPLFGLFLLHGSCPFPFQFTTVFSVRQSGYGGSL